MALATPTCGDLVKHVIREGPLGSAYIVPLPLGRPSFVPISLFCGLLLVVGANAYDAVNWSVNQTFSEAIYRAQLDDLISTLLNFIDLEAIGGGGDPALGRKLEKVRFHPLNLYELSEATEGICHSFRERISKLSKVVSMQTESYEHLLGKLRKAMDFFTRYDHLPAAIREHKYALDLAKAGDPRYVGYTYSPDITAETVVDGETEEYLSGVTELEDLFDSEGLPTLNDARDIDGIESSAASDHLLEDRIGSIQEFEETLDVISIPGVPGEDFPNYEEIPTTPFSCEDKEYIPGFYADQDASCQVFHVCWPHYRETFLCPTGSTFNQELFYCDYWHKSNCSLSPSFYNSNAKYLPEESLSAVHQSKDSTSSESYTSTLLLSSNGIKFFPTKFKTYSYPEGKRELDGPLNLFNWKLEKMLKMKAKSEDDFVDAILQNKDWIRGLVSVHDSEKETVDNVSEQTPSESPNSEEKFELKPTLKIKKYLFDTTSKSKSDRSGVESTTLVLEASTDSTQIAEKAPTTTDSEITSDSTETTEYNLDFTSLVSEESKFSTPGPKQESDSNKTVSKVSNTRKLKSLFPKLKLQKAVVDKENIAPAIVQHVLKTAESIVKEGILPLTRQILAESYSKHHKMKY